MRRCSRYDVETWVCSVRGHVTPAATVGRLRPAEGGLGIDIDPEWRLARCLRCDAWIAVARPDPVTDDGVPLLERLRTADLPRRGRRLRQAIVLRAIAVERGIHCLLFVLVAVLAGLLRADLVTIQSSVRRLLDSLTRNEQQTGRVTNHSIVVREGGRILRLRSGTLEVLILVAVAYAIVEGVEAVGLWFERRWAEYLTAVATAGFLPLEVHELTKRVSVFRLGALVVNLAILAYLVYAKGLFGVGRARRAIREAEEPDPALRFARPGVVEG